MKESAPCLLLGSMKLNRGVGVEGGGENGGKYDGEEEEGCGPLSELEEDLFVVCRFMNDFGKYLEGKEGGGGCCDVVTARDVVGAMRLDRKVDYLDRLEAALEVYDGDNGKMKNSSVSKSLALERRNATSQDLKLNVSDLRRVASSISSHLADHLFILHSGEAACSPLLNMPLASYFDSHHPPKLLIRPDVITWREYARLSIMLALLPSHHAIAQTSRSVLAATSSYLYNPSKNTPTNHGTPTHQNSSDLLSDRAAFHQTDLLALWIRAQRNTAAFRHLMFLFTFQEHKTTPTHCPHTQLNHLTYTATFSGNQKKTRLRVEKETSYLDSLVDWAVTNQLFFTYPHVRDILTGKRKYAQEPINKQNHHAPKRKSSNHHQQTPQNYKRQKLPNSSHDTQTPHAPLITSISQLSMNIIRACKSYTLRWFARRNRNLLSILFSSNPPSIPDEPQRSAVEQTLAIFIQSQIPEKVKTYIKNEFQSSDRTFARIDRRLKIGKYDLAAIEPKNATNDQNNNVHPDSDQFNKTVLDLLNAFQHVAPSEMKPEIQRAKQDFHLLSTQSIFIFNETCKLVKNLSQFPMLPTTQHHHTTILNERIGSILASHPMPWPSYCVFCNKEQICTKLFASATTKDHDLSECYNCGNVAHKKCIPESHSGIVGYKEDENSFRNLRHYPPLHSIFCPWLPQPAVAPMPDSELASIVWKKIWVALTRSDPTSSWGIVLNHTENCCMGLDTVLSPSFRGDLPGPFPFQIDLRGIIIEDIVDNSSAQKSDLRLWDLATAIEIAEPSDSGSSFSWVRHDFAELEHADRVALFKNDCRAIRLEVQRPSINLAEKGNLWLDNVQTFFKNNIQIDEELAPSCGITNSGDVPSRWYCTDCQQKGGDESNLINRSGSNSDFIREAAHCRAVIRRLGMEWSALPFLDESMNHQSLSGASDEDDTAHVSFRRLDLMMGVLMEREETPPNNKSPKTAWDPFKKPPWARRKNQGQQKLSWASPDSSIRPMELLCRGMRLILLNNQNKEHLQRRCRDLARDFLVLFTAWCLDAFDGDWGKRKTVGPPNSAFCAVEPWLTTGCVICGVRPQRTQQHSEPGWPEGVCDCQQCRNLACASKDGNRSNPETLDSEADPAADTKVADAHFLSGETNRALARYDFYSSYVGSVMFLHPTDPLISGITRALGFDIEPMGRVIELVVVSYLPKQCLPAGSRFQSLVVNDGDENKPESTHTNEGNSEEGIFHAFPILSQKQLQFLLPLCKMRESKPDTSDLWLEMDVLSLPGVVKLTPSDLREQFRKSKAMCDAVTDAVASIAMHQNDGEDVSTGITNSPRPTRVERNEQYPSRIFHTLSSLRASSEFGDSFLQKENVDRLIEKNVSILAVEYSSLVDLLTSVGAPIIRNSAPVVLDTDEDEEETDVDETDDDLSTIETLKHRKAMQNNSFNDSFWFREESLNNDKDSSISLPKAAEEKLCRVSYSDFIGRNPKADEMSSLKRVLLKQVLHTPKPLPTNTQMNESIFDDVSDHTVVLRRNQPSEEKDGSDEEYIPEQDLLEDDGDGDEATSTVTGIRSKPKDYRYLGNGWGIELVRWSAEPRVLRVGRVLPNSPASESGLMIHDAIVAINAQPVDKIGPDSALARAMLCASTIQLSQIETSNYATKIMHSMKKPCPGPVVIQIRRMCFPHQTTITNQQTDMEESNSNAFVAVSGTDEPSTKPDTGTHFGDTNHDEIDQRACSLLKSPDNHQESKATNQHDKSVHKEAQIQNGDALASGKRSAKANSNEDQTDNDSAKLVDFQAADKTQQLSLQRPADHRALHSRHKLTGVPSQQNRPREIKNSNQRSDFSEDDLYKPFLKGCVLTLAETALLFEASCKSSPYLGVRLLCPRYGKDLVIQQWATIIRPFLSLNSVNSLPLLPQDFWKHIIIADYQRSLDESGPIEFTENGYSYREPTEILPVDRLLEKFMRENRERKQTSSTGMAPAPLTETVLQNPNYQPEHLSAIQSPTKADHSTGFPEQRTRSASHIHAIDDSWVSGPTQNHDINTQKNRKLTSPQHENGSVDAPVLMSSQGNVDLRNLSPSPQRIRGGGLGQEVPYPEHQDTIETRKHVLADFNQSLWPGLGVIGKCVAKGTITEETAKFIGQLRSVDSDGAVLVDVFHVSNVGFLDKVRTTRVRADMLEVVAASSKEAEALYCFKQKRRLVATQGSVEGKMNDAGEHLDQTEIVPEPYQTPSQIGKNMTENHSKKTAHQKSFPREISLLQAGRTFVERVRRRYRGNSDYLLGYLPDGRAVVWMESDPYALYIRAPTNEGGKDVSTHFSDGLQRRFCQQVQQETSYRRNKTYFQVCERGRYCCIWGCSEPVDIVDNNRRARKMLSFASRQELSRHIALSHNFGSLGKDNDSPDATMLKGWIRVSEGSNILHLGVDLTSAICARCFYFASAATSVKQKFQPKGDSFCHSPFWVPLMFDIDKILDLSKSGQGSPAFKRFGRLKKFSTLEVRKYVRLWSRICRLFSLEDSGLFRLRKEFDIDGNAAECIGKKCWNMGTSSSSHSFDNDREAQKSDEMELFRLLEKDIANKKKEHKIGKNAREIESDSKERKKNEIQDCHTLLTDVYLPRSNARNNELTKRIEDLNCRRDDLNTVKVLMMTVASKVPPALRKAIPVAPETKQGQANDLDIFTGEMCLLWCSFIHRCCDGKMLAQAYTILVNSINKARMAKWWKALKAGWASSLLVLDNPTLSNIALNLQVLDAAVADFLVNNGEPVPENVVNNHSTANDMKTTEHVDTDTDTHTDADTNTDTDTDIDSSTTGSLRMKTPKKNQNQSELDKLWDNPSLQHLKGLGLMERMKTVAKWADALDLCRYYDDHGKDFCMVCDEGGDLMCCEYCVNVQHLECCTPPESKEPSLWVCDECIRDISALHYVSLNEI